MQRGHKAANLGGLRQGLGGATNWPQGCPSQGWVAGRADPGWLSGILLPGNAHTGHSAAPERLRKKWGFSKGFGTPTSEKLAWRALHAVHLKVCWDLMLACVYQHVGDR